MEAEQELLKNKIDERIALEKQTPESKHLVNNYQYTSDLIQLYNNLNNKYRYDAYESLGFIKEIQNMTEFKLKLLFSVVVVSVRSFIFLKI